MRVRPKILSIFLSAVSSVAAFVNGNPAQPSLISESVLREKNEKFSMRMGFLDDYVYGQHFRNEFPEHSEEFPEEFAIEKPPVAKISTEAGVVTMNFVRRLDIYGIFGSSRLQLDQEIFGRRQFAWGIGTKAIVYQMDAFRIGCDFKYFTTTQDPLYLVVSGIPLNVVSDLDLKYREYQASLGMSYQSGIVSPYILGTYLNSKIDPNMHYFLVRMPGSDELCEPKFSSYIGAQTWGMAVGATLVMGSKGILSIESRFFNQNGIDATLEIRF